MSESVLLVVYTLAALALLVALGLGPAAFLARGLAGWGAIVPAVGLATGLCLLSTASAVLPIKVATWTLLVPAAAASTAWGVAQVAVADGPAPAKAGSGSGRRDWGVLLGLSFLALALPLGPALAHGTVGPYGLAAADAFNNVFAGLWFEAHPIVADAPGGAERHDLALQAGYEWQQSGTRPGLFALLTASAALLGIGVASVNVAFGAAVLALLPVSIWFIARDLGAAPLPSLFAAAFGLSPAIVMLAADSAIANLGGLVLAPLALTVASRAVEGGEPRLIALTGLLLGGFVACYSELLPVFLASVAAALTLHWALRSRGERSLSRLVPAAKRLALAAGACFAFAPVAAVQAERWLVNLGTSPGFIEIPRSLDLQTAGAWATGVLHLYELQRFELFSLPRTAVALLLPAVLLAGLVYGLLRGPRRALLLVGVPIGVGLLVGIYSGERYDPACEYCQWKQWTFILPFLAVGFGVSLTTMLGSRGRGRRPAAITLTTLAVAIAALGALARSDLDLVTDLHRSSAHTTSAERELSDRLEALPGRPAVLLEGMDATAFPLWDTAEAYLLAHDGDVGPIRLSPSGLSLVHFLTERSDHYSPDYDYVVTLLDGTRTERPPIDRAGPYAIQRRAPIDVTVRDAGWAVEPSDSRSTLWIQGPLELRVSSPRRRRVALILRLEGRDAGRAQLRFRAGRRSLETLRRGTRLCVATTLRRDGEAISVRPRLGAPPDELFPSRDGGGIAFFAPFYDGRLSMRSDPAGASPPRLVGIAALRARPGGCGRAQPRPLSAAGRT